MSFVCKSCLNGTVLLNFKKQIQEPEIPNSLNFHSDNSGKSEVQILQEQMLTLQKQMKTIMISMLEKDKIIERLQKKVRIFHTHV